MVGKYDVIMVRSLDAEGKAKKNEHKTKKKVSVREKTGGGKFSTNLLTENRMTYSIFKAFFKKTRTTKCISFSIVIPAM